MTDSCRTARKSNSSTNVGSSRSANTITPDTPHTPRIKPTPSATYPTVPPRAPPTTGIQFPMAYFTPRMARVSARPARAVLAVRVREMRNMTRERSPVYHFLIWLAREASVRRVPNASIKAKDIQMAQTGGVTEVLT